MYSNESLETFDNTLYITSAAFETFDFYPDDIAGVMIHEGVHAWQEVVALQQVGLDALTDTWYYKYRNGVERQAYEVVLKMNGNRLRMSNYPQHAERIIKDNYQAGEDSPFVLPAGVP